MIETSPSPLSPNRSWFLVTATVAFLMAAGFSGYFQLKNSSLQSQISDLQNQKETLEKASADAAQTQTRRVAPSLLPVKATLKSIETDQLFWSKIIEKIETTVPKIKDSNEAIIVLRSYNGSEEGKIAVSATTRGVSADPFSDIALAVRAYAADPAFRGVFIPSITKSLTPDGTTVLSFSLNLEYVHPTQNS